MTTRTDLMQAILDKMAFLLEGDWHQGWLPAEAVEELAEAYAALADAEDLPEPTQAPTPPIEHDGV